MDEIKSFVLHFLKKEHEFIRNKYDENISDELCSKSANELNSLFSELNSPKYKRNGREFKNESKKKFSLISLNRAIPRVLFQIKKYEKFTLGDNLKKIVTGKELYACYVSFEENNGLPLNYCDIFYVSETSEGLKIIYRKIYDNRTGEWMHHHDLKLLQVVSSGELVAVEKYQAPEEATSLADYNAE